MNLDQSDIMLYWYISFNRLWFGLLTRWAVSEEHASTVFPNSTRDVTMHYYVFFFFFLSELVFKNIFVWKILIQMIFFHFPRNITFLRKLEIGCENVLTEYIV